MKRAVIAINAIMAVLLVWPLATDTAFWSSNDLEGVSYAVVALTSILVPFLWMRLTVVLWAFAAVALAVLGLGYFIRGMCPLIFILGVLALLSSGVVVWMRAAASTKGPALGDQQPAPKFPKMGTPLVQGIVFGVFFQYLGYFIKDVSKKYSPSYIGGVVAIVLGVLIFAWGCSHLVTAKRLPKWANALGLLSFVGLAVLWWWPVETPKTAPQPTE